MSNLPADFPSAVHTRFDIGALTAGLLGETNPSHVQVHGKIEEELYAISRKLGIGDHPASGASRGAVLSRRDDTHTDWLPQMVNIFSYGAVGAGGDDTAAIQAALDENEAVYFPLGIYKTNLLTISGKNTVIYCDPGTVFIQTDINGFLSWRGGWEYDVAISSIATALVNTAFASQSANNLYVSQVTLGSNKTVARGDVFKVLSDDELAGALVTGTSFKKRRGEFAIAGIDSALNVVSFAHILKDTYTTSPRLAKLQDYTFKMFNATITIDSSIRASAESGGTITPTLEVKAGRNCLIKNCRFKDLFTTGISLRGCYNSVVEDTWCENFDNKPSFNHYGYGVTDSGEGTLVKNCYFQNVRHGYTTNTEAILTGNTTPENYGRTRNCFISDCEAIDCSSSGFDTHEECDGITFNNCVSRGTAMTARGYNVSYDNCLVRDAVNGYIFTGVEGYYLTNSRALEIKEWGMKIEMATNQGGLTAQKNVFVRNCYLESGKYQPGTYVAGIYCGRSGYTTKVVLDNNYFKILGDVSSTGGRTFTMWGAEFRVRNCIVNMEDMALDNTRNYFLFLCNDASCNVKINGLEVIGGGHLAIMQLLAGSGSMEALNVTYQHNATAPAAITSASYTTPRHGYRHLIGSTKTSSARVTQAASAAGVVSAAVGQSPDPIIHYALTGTAGAVTMGALPAGWYPGQMMVIYNGSNGTVGFSGAAYTVATTVSLILMWSGSAWIQIM